jgi:hypothetical protein
MIKDGDNVKFENYLRITSGDEIIMFDTTINQLITSVVTNVNFRFDKFTAYTLDFEELDLFLTLEETENQSRYGLVTHNYGYDCYFWRIQYFSGPGYGYAYYTCTGGGYAQGWGWNAGLNGPCSRATYSGAWPVVFIYSPGSSNRLRGTLCNNQKSDIGYKENLTLIGTSNNGINIYEFKYKDKEGLYKGVIAQELIGTEYEDALSINADGLYEVDYDKIDVQFQKF